MTIKKDLTIDEQTGENIAKDVEVITKIQRQILRQRRIEKLAKTELRRLKKIFRDLPKDTQAIVLPIIRNVAFMTVTLDDLQETINKDGVVVEYQNGENQWGTKKSPEVDVYNTMIKNYNTTVKQLAEFLPKGSDDDEANDIMKFAMKSRK